MLSNREGCDALTKKMDKLNMQTCFVPICIKDLKPQYNRISKEDIIILEKKSTTTKLKVRMVSNGKHKESGLQRRILQVP